MIYDDIYVEIDSEDEEEFVEQEYEVEESEIEGIRVGIQALKDVINYNNSQLKPKTYALAFGGATYKLATKLYKNGIKTVYANSDTRNFSKVDCSKKIALSNYYLGYHNDCMGVQKIGEAIMENDQIQIYDQIKDANTIILIGNVGGGTAGGAMLQFLKFLKKQPLPMAIVVIAILPFSAERTRRKIALQTLEKIKEIHDVVIVIDNDSLSPNANALKAISARDDKIVEIALHLKKKTEEAFYEKLKDLLPNKQEIKAIASRVKAETEEVEETADDVVIAG